MHVNVSMHVYVFPDGPENAWPRVTTRYNDLRFRRVNGTVQTPLAEHELKAVRKCARARTPAEERTPARTCADECAASLSTWRSRLSDCPSASAVASQGVAADDTAYAYTATPGHAEYISAAELAPPHRRRLGLLPGAWLWLCATSLQAQAEACLLGLHTNRDDDEALLPRDATAVGQAGAEDEGIVSSASGVLPPATSGLSLHMVDASAETTSMPQTPVLWDSTAHLASQLLATISSSSKSESSNESTQRLLLYPRYQSNTAGGLSISPACEEPKDAAAAVTAVVFAAFSLQLALGASGGGGQH